MTISSENRKAGPFDGNGTATEFPFTFKVFADSDLVVVYTDATGTESTLVLNTGYTVTLNSDQDASPGGTVTLPAALATGDKLTLTSGVLALQLLDLTNQGGFYPVVINRALDRTIAVIQQLKEQVGRSWKIPISSDVTSADHLMADVFAAATAAVEAADRVDLGALDDAVAQVEAARDEVAAAQAAADISEAAAAASAAAAAAARDAAQLSSGIYATTAAGLAATASGGYFSVPSADNAEYLILYLDSAGTAVEVKRYPSAELIRQLVPLAPAGYSWALVDKDGLAAFGVLADGTLVASRFEAGEIDVTALTAQSYLVGADSISNQAPAGWAWMLVDQYGMSAGGFLSDGTFRVGEVNADSLTADLINGAPADWIPSQYKDGTYASDIAHIISYGQSLSLGNGSNPITTTQAYDSLMFNSGMRPQEGPGTVAADHASFVTMVEALNGSTGNGETPLGNAAATIKRLILNENVLPYAEQSYQLLGSAPGVSNTQIALLGKAGGSPGYAQLIDDVTYGLANSQSLGKSYAVPTVYWSQGEKDYELATSYASYLAAFLQLYTDLNTDIKALTGQPDNIQIIGYQCIYSSPATVALAQLEASVQNPAIHLACPGYIFPRIAPGNVHLNGTGYAQLGAYYGLVHKRVVVDGAEWQPLTAKRVYRQGAIIMAQMHTPVRPLVIDSTLQLAAPNSGFTLVDSGGVDIPITSVAVAGPDTVRIVASTTVPAGARLRYGYVARSDGLLGGNLRDSQGDSLTDGLSIPGPLHNWCLAFQFTIA